MSDLISRADAIEAVKSAYKEPMPISLAYPLADIINILNALPSAEAVQGEWVYIDNYFRVATCSRCHKVTMFEKWGAHTKPFNYCPKCGAKMSGYVFNDDFVESEIEE